MAIATAYFAQDLAAMIADLPTVARWAGVDTFDCSCTTLTDEETLLLVGNLTRKTVRVVFPSTAFTVTAAFKPQALLELKYPNPAAFSSYEIVSVGLSPDFLSYDVVLKANNRA